MKDFLTKDLAVDESAPGKSQPAADFIRFKIEPFFEYILYLIGILVIAAGAANSVATGVSELKKNERGQDEIFTLMRIRSGSN